jgi:N-acetylglucosamine kinase-like BadF-type ATPase
MNSQIVVAVDLGGTWLRVLAAGRTGRRIFSLRKPATNLEQLPRALSRIFKSRGITPKELRVASRGVWKKEKRLALERALSPLASRVIVMSDVEAARLAAFGTLTPPLSPEVRGRKTKSPLPSGERPDAKRPGEGILVISGTGSIALGKYRNSFKRAGGLGPEKGDEGSGYWIGKEWLKKGPIPLPKGSTVRQIAALAPTVIRKARRDPRALVIVTKARAELASLVTKTARRLRWKGTLTVSWAGGVLENEFFRAGFQRMVEARWSPGVEWITPRQTAVEALCRHPGG